jgi:hypothetical protein
MRTVLPKWNEADRFGKSEIPFNLAGELLDNSTTAEGEARVRALAEAEARKAQQTFDGMSHPAFGNIRLPFNDKETK